MGPLKTKAMIEREAYKCYLYHDYIDKNHNIANHVLEILEKKKHGGSVICQFLIFQELFKANNRDISIFL